MNRLGKDPLSWIGDSKTAKQPDRKPASRQDGKTAKRHDVKTSKRQKVTFYTDPDLVKRIKIKAIEENMKLSDLITKALKTYLEG